MRILMLAQFFSPVIGGEERHVFSLSEALVARGHEVTVATMPHPKRDPDTTINGVRVVSLYGTMRRLAALFSEPERPHHPPFPDPEVLLSLRRLIESFKPDIVHGHNWLIHSFLPLKRSGGPGFVVTLHDYGLVCAIKTLTRGDKTCPGPAPSRCLPCAWNHFHGLKGPVTYLGNSISEVLERRVIDHAIPVSRAVAERSGIVGSKIPYDVIPTLIPDDTGSLPPVQDGRLGGLPRAGYLLFVGDLNRRKGCDIIIEAYRLLKDPPPLVMIGRRCPDTPTDLPPNVQIFESWPHWAVMHAWSRCLFGLVPSSWVEPCGTVFMEANAVGKAAIATNHGGPGELIKDGVNGLLIPPRDPNALAAAMRRLIEDRPLLEMLSAKALAHSETFKSHSIVPRIEQVYTSVLSRKHRAAPARAPALSVAEG